MDCDLAVSQYPAIGKPHARGPIRRGCFHDLDYHQGTIIVFAPKRDFDIQIFERKDPLEMFTQLVPTSVIARLAVIAEATYEQRVGSILVENAIDILLEDES